MQGATSSTEAQFVVALPKNEDLQIEVLSTATGKVLLKTIGKPIQYDHSGWKLVQFRLSDLQPARTYQLRLKGSSGNWVDRRLFHTFKINPKNIKIGVVSCARDDLKGFQEIWHQLKKENIETLLMIGDNTYADLGLKGMMSKMTVERLWDRHMETRNKLPFFRWKKLVPVFATWDDHDYGSNNGGRDFSLKQASAKIFSSFFPMKLTTADFSKGPGVSRAMSLGRQRLIFFDNRSFRAPKSAQTARFHFGQEQVNWALKQFRKDSLNWLISGDQFFGGYHPFESFEGTHPKAFKEFKNQVKNIKAPVLFISGDRHLTEIMKISKGMIGHQTYEITSSPIHSSVYDDALEKHKNDLRVGAVDGEWNYVTLDVGTEGKFHKLKTVSKGLPEKTFFSHSLKIVQ